MFHNQAGLRFSVFLIKRKDIFGFDKNDTRKKLEENIHTKPPFISEKKKKKESVPVCGTQNGRRSYQRNEAPACMRDACNTQPCTTQPSSTLFLIVHTQTECGCLQGLSSTATSETRQRKQLTSSLCTGTHTHTVVCTTQTIE